MQVRIGKDENEWIKQAWTWLHDEVTPGSRVFVPAGGTPEPFYRRWSAEPTSLLKSLRLVQIDEILTGPEKGHFRKFFERELAGFTEQMEWIDHADACDQGRAGADIAVLGVGVNGHVAFHEPGLPRHFVSGCVRLSKETLNYLNLSDPTWGVTYGVGAFIRAKKILVMVKGARKQPIMRRALAKGDLPISWILEHPNVTVVSDFAIG